MPTLDVTMCGVLLDDGQDMKQKSDIQHHRMTAFVIPFMVGNQLCPGIEGQGMVVSAK
jgi:hypothetical protein